MLFTLRPQDALPNFVTHLALVGENRDRLTFGPREEVLSTAQGRAMLEQGERHRAKTTQRRKRIRLDAEHRDRSPVVEISRLNVTYTSQDVPKRVLRDVDWTVRQGDRWVLAGHNGTSHSLPAKYLATHANEQARARARCWRSSLATIRARIRKTFACSDRQGIKSQQ